MKVTILVVNIVLPMLVSIGLYCYAFLSTRWTAIDNDRIAQYNGTNKQLESSAGNNRSAQLDNQLVRHAFRSRSGLFGYCLDYKWLTLVTIASDKHRAQQTQSSAMLPSPTCNDSSVYCPETNTCERKCDSIPSCPSYADEDKCGHLANRTHYYWTEEKCMWRQLISIDYQGIPDYFSFGSSSTRGAYNYKKHLLHAIMLALFLAAPLFIFTALLILFCINCVDRFYSIPFAFVSLFSLASFVTGAGALGLFLHQWTHDRIQQPDFIRGSETIEPWLVPLNPWLVDVERLGLAFWLATGAIGASLLTTILSCCFCCGLQSEKSKLRIHVNNKKYVIVHANPYDE